MKTIDVQTLHDRLAEDAWPRRGWALFDVREAGESQKGHIPGATFLPRRMLEFRLPELISAPATPIVLYDSGEEGDARAVRAAATMERFGYADVTLLKDGMVAWAAAGYDVATGWNVPSKDFGERVLVTTDVPYLTADELAARIDAGENIGSFDVRTPDEYREGSLPVSLSGPSFDWALHAKDISEKYDGIVIHCAGRTRSIIGAATARLLGLENFWALENGTMGWRLSERDLAVGQSGALGAPSGASREAATEKARQAALDAGSVFISPSELAARMDARATRQIHLFDTRDQEGYGGGHIAGAVWLPGGQACQRADDFAAVPGAPVVFVDDGDARAALSAYWFKRMGFPDVMVLEGGVPAWADAGYALETGRGRPHPLGLDAAAGKVDAVDATELARALSSDEPPLVIDVGTSRHVAKCHVAGAAWVPRGYLEDRIAAVADPETPVVVTAWQPEQATLAAATLADMGYKNVWRLAEPGKRWAGLFAVESGLPEDAEGAADTLAIPYRQNKERMLEYLEWEEKLGEKHRQAAKDANRG